MVFGSGLPQSFNPHKYDMIVVGAGFAGSVCARRIAEGLGIHVAVLERRGHVAGNAYDCVNEAGIRVHVFGPHVYHTKSQRVDSFLSRFTEWTDYRHRVLADVHGVLMPVPFNRQSLQLAFGPARAERLFDKLVATFGKDVTVPILELRDTNDPDLAEVADYVFENIFYHYSVKQWGKTPDELDPVVLDRVPILIGECDLYYPEARFQGLPCDGYTAMFERMLHHDLIDVFCDVDARDLISFEETRTLFANEPYGGEIIYTGPLDELFGFEFGVLPYRSLELGVETLDQDRFQPVGTINYTVSEAFTRITEFKILTEQDVPGKTTIMREYSRPWSPSSGQIPYYAVIDRESRALYDRYLERVRELTNFHPVGRLAEYRYYDMDAVTESALELSDEIIALHA
ncbi:UDP-galactopyranose mutase [Collinsella sp. AGMB00827]|uniref:UDP-galactopyranose mutase n=1 Tax=Collinsella ureilytica TaxID=2869515 RepID=A0ABS7MHX9_9ACTN|nr:UDP-galactopyranose mutase [Collinsella urealyticum]MBY4796964.1 UDP-galactopyranose mutase [Collinsella urealyticum]